MGEDRPKIVRDFQFPRNKDEMPMGPKQRGGILTESNAGWRIEHPVVDHDKCIKCLMCWVFCPEGVIDKAIQIDMDFCKGCGVCANECPKKAITMVPEGK